MKYKILGNVMIIVSFAGIWTKNDMTWGISIILALMCFIAADILEKL